MRIVATLDGGETSIELDKAQLAEVLADEHALVWVDLNGDAPAQAREILAEIFKFHPLAIDDTLNQVHLPKVDDWGEYLYIVLRGVVYDEQKHVLALPELDIFLGENYLVTYHETIVDGVGKLWGSSQEDERLFQNGSAYLLYRLMDELIDRHIQVIERMEDSLEVIESRVFREIGPRVQREILRLKHAILRIRRIVALQREVLNRLARDSYQVIDDNERLYFRDVYDHLIRLYDLIDGLRDLVTGVLDVYLSVASNRMNEVMKTLTVITTLFMPLTFITGFFGMNFFQPALGSLAVWTDRDAFLLVLLFLILLPFMMYLWMKRRAWME